MADKAIASFFGKYRFLSNFYRHDVEFEGMTYPTNEHAFQAAKTLSAEVRAMIQNASSPGFAKQLGREIPLRPFWEDIKVGIMQGLVIAKFQDETLRDMLLETHPATLIECNRWGDRFWGACADRAGTGKQRDWPTPFGTFYGQNHLGILLMDYRNTLRED